VTDKLTRITDNIYCCRSGSAADTQAVADMVTYHLDFHRCVVHAHVRVRVSVHSVFSPCSALFCFEDLSFVYHLPGTYSLTCSFAWFPCLHAHAHGSVQMGRPALVETAANVFKEICYSNRDSLSAGIICAGWDERKGGQVRAVRTCPCTLHAWLRP
jgi:20S proteasome alpha/beta subunit